MKYFGKSDKSLYSSMSDLKDGCYPITNSGVWHSGIHVYFSEENNELIKNPIAGKVVACNFDEKKDWHYIVIENDINFPDMKKGKTAGYHCYNLIGNLMGKMPYDDLLNKKHKITKDVLTKLTNIPFYISLKTQLPKNTCEDPDNYKIFNINLCRTESNPVFCPKADGGYDDLIPINKTDTVKKDSVVKSYNGQVIGTIVNDFGIDSDEFEDFSLKDKGIIFKGKNCKLDDGLLTGYVILKNKTINAYGNIKYENKSELILWREKEENIKKYPGFGLVVTKKLKIWDKVIELLTEEKKKELKALLDSDNEKYIFVVEKDINIFPFIDEKLSGGISYKIKDPDGNIVQKFLLNHNEYNLIKNELIGFFKKNNDIYHSYSEVWDECSFTYDIMEKINIGSIYNNFFNGVKVIDVYGKPVNYYQAGKTKLISSYYSKVKLHCFENDEYSGLTSTENIYKKMIYISSPYSLYTFKDTCTLDNFPCSEKTGVPSTSFEFSNVEEVLKSIQDNSEYIWLKNSEQQVYVNKKIYKDLQIEIVKNKVKRGDYIGVGTKLGYPFWSEAPNENEIPASKPYIDYALFFTEDITTQDNKLENITIKEGEDCFIEEKDYTEQSDCIFIPPHATDIVYKSVDNTRECVKLESVSYKAYVYPDWIQNYKIKSDSAVILFYSSQCRVQITNGEITSITPKFTEQQESLIKSIVNEIFPKMKTNNLEARTDGVGNKVYRYVYKKEYNTFVKNDMGVIENCKFLPIYNESSHFVEGKIPSGGYNAVLSSTSIEDQLINGNVCNGFIIDNKLFYVSKNIVDDGTTNLLSEFMENAKKINFGKNAIASKDICPVDELLIQEEDGKENIQKLRKLLRDDLVKENKELLDYVYTDEKDYGFKIYDEDKEYSKLLQEYLCKFMSKHPIEFDFDKMDKEKVSKKRNLKPFDKSKDSDVYAGLKSADSSTFKTNSFYFVCPPYFYNKMEELGLMFENPYQGVNEYSRLGGKKDPKYEFKINPGFAPCCEEQGKNGKFIYEKEINGKTWYFAALNNPFGYSNGYFSKQYYHTGIDYPGTNDENIKNAPIMALIRGRIWACTTGNGSIRDSDTGGSYGRCMIIKGDNDYLYILGHLQDFAGHKAGDYVSPGEIVAHAGNTGNSDVTHLHLELLYCKAGMDDESRGNVLDMEYNQLHENDGEKKGEGKNFLRFATGDDTIWKLKNYRDWKKYRLNPLTGEKK